MSSLSYPKKIFFFLLLLIHIKQGFACAVCGTALEASRKAFIYSTALLSLAPLIMLGGLFFYFYRKYRNREISQQENNVSDNNEPEDNHLR